MITGLLSSILTLSVVAMLGAGQAAAPRAPSAAGHWTGAIELPTGPLAVEIDLTPDTPPAWRGAISIAAQNLKAFPLGRIDVAGTSITLVIANIPGDPTFKGTLSADGQTIAGDFTQGPGTLPFKLTRAGDAVFAPLPKSTAIGKEFEGRWTGTLQTPGPALRLTMTLANGPDGATGSLISVDQGGAEVAIASVVQSGGRITLELPKIAATFAGELKDGRVVGTWTQGPQTMPLEFARVP